MCVQFPVTVPINGVISCEDFDQNFQSLKAFVDAFCNLDEIVANIEMWAAEAEASAEAAELALSQIQTIQTQLQPLVDSITELLNLEANLADILAVEAALVNINTVASNIANVNTVAAGMASVVIVATNIANVNTVANDIVNVNNVGGDIANVNIVAGDIANVNTVANNMLDLLQIVTNLAVILDAENQADIAVQAAADAIAAAGTIAGQIDFTGAVEGDLLRHNGSEFVRISRQDLGAQKQLFERSSIYSAKDYDNIFAWDNFIRPNSGGLGVSDSGHTWDNLIGNGYSITNNTALANTSNNISKINTGVGAICVESDIVTGFANRRNGLIIGKDINNYFEFRNAPGPVNLLIESTIAGVTTTLASVSLVTQLGNIVYSILEKNINIRFTYYFNAGGNSYLTVTSRDLPKLYLEANVTSLSGTYVSNSDVSFAGIRGSNLSGYRNISIFKL